MELTFVTDSSATVQLACECLEDLLGSVVDFPTSDGSTHAHVNVTDLSNDSLRILFTNVALWEPVFELLIPHIYRHDGVFRRAKKSLRRNFAFHNLTDAQLLRKVSEAAQLLPLIDNKTPWPHFTRRYSWNFLPVWIHRKFAFHPPPLGADFAKYSHNTVEVRFGNFENQTDYPHMFTFSRAVVENMHAEVIQSPFCESIRDDDCDKSAHFEFLMRSVLRQEDLWDRWKIGYGEKWPDCWRKFDSEAARACEKRKDRIINFPDMEYQRPNIPWDIALNGGWRRAEND